MPALIIITASQTSEILPQFSTPVTFESPTFQNEATYLKSETACNINDWRVCPKFGTVFMHLQEPVSI